MMLEQEDIELEGKTYVLSKFPATVGREVIMQYPSSALPKIGEYKTNHALMVKIMGYVGVRVEGRDEPIRLSTEALIDNHVKSAETLVRLEWAMMQHNYSFFKDGRASGFLDLLMGKVNESISKTLTGLLPLLSGND